MASIPETMKVVEISKPGGPEVLKPAERPVPKPEDGQILIKVEAAGVNRPDALQRSGAYPPPPGASDLPGLECAGEVAAIGAGVFNWKVGDKVCALLPGGGYAEYALTHESHALPIPEGLTALEAAALPETCFTVWTNVFDRGGLKEGESLLIHGGSSGIGTTAIQMASAFGARVFVTAGSSEKCRFCEGIGAERAINYRSEDFVEVIKEATDGGVNLVLDMVGGEYLARDVKALATDGRLCMIAFLGGAKANLDFSKVMIKRLTITGSTLRPQSVEAKAAIADNVREKVWPLIASGQIAPILDSAYPLGDAAAAHARMESSAHIGKIVLEV